MENLKFAYELSKNNIECDGVKVFSAIENLIEFRVNFTSHV